MRLRHQPRWQDRGRHPRHASPRRRQPDAFVAVNAADVFVEAREALKSLDLDEPPACLEGAVSPAEERTKTSGGGVAAAALSLASYYRSAGALALCGYAITASTRVRSSIEGRLQR